jgi:hypothetical protein
MDFDDFIMPFIVIFGVIAATAGLIGLLMVWECSSYREVTGKQTKLAGGSCYIQENDEWYRWDEYKYRFATKGERK